ncbi:hypothetical protein [Natronobeatus ordinarius]|uniref:hypothetical protein n=1 Tax=Natronobeatus ordinarius TaxID=2963433 RepID=UPI0020CFE5E6|nr:hypothetical protein [Natronobeatus ordinarius]
MNYNTSKTTKSLGRTALVVTMALVMVASMVAMPLGAAFLPGVDATHSGVAAADDGDSGICESSYRWIAHFTTGGLTGAYCVVTGLLDDPDDASNSVELEEGAYVQHGQIDALHHDMMSDFRQYYDEQQYLAFIEGEQAIVEARYDDESISTARSSARMETNGYYADHYAGLLDGHNDLVTEAFIWGKATYADDNADAIIYFQEGFHHSQSGNYRAEYADIYVTADSEIETDEYTLPDGDTVEYITAISNVDVVPYDDYDADHTPSIIEEEDGSLTFDVETFMLTGSGSTGTNQIVGEDPNRDASELIVLGDSDGNHNPIAWIEEKYETQRPATLDLVEDRAEEVYSEVDAGELSPDEYFGPREFLETYGSGMGIDAAVDLYFHATVGYTTAPDMMMTVAYDGDDYQGGVLTNSPEDAPLVYDEEPLPISEDGDVVLSSHDHMGVLEFDEDGYAVIEFSNNSAHETDAINIEIINVDEFSVSHGDATVSAEFNVDDMQDEEFIIFEAVVEVYDEEENELEEERSGTYVLFEDDSTEEIRGWVVGESYDGDDTWMIYQSSSESTDDINFEGDWTLTSNYGVDGDEKAVATVFEAVDTSYDGVSAWDRIDMQQAIQDAIDSRDDIDTGGGSGDDGFGAGALIAAFGFGAVVIMGVGLLLVLLYLVGNITRVA